MLHFLRKTQLTLYLYFLNTAFYSIFVVKFSQDQVERKWFRLLTQIGNSIDVSSADNVLQFL